MKKDVVALSGLVVLGGVLLFLVGGHRAPSVTATATEPEAAPESRVTYRFEGASPGLRFVEIEMGSAGPAHVRFQPRGGEVVERDHDVAEPTRRQILDLLATSGFLDAEEVPRKILLKGEPRVTIAATIGERWNELRLDERTRPSIQLDELLAAFEALRVDATPEAVATGD